jgi:hypothetical protein
MFEREKLSYAAVQLSARAELTDEQMQAAALAYYQTMQQRHTVRDFIDREVKRSFNIVFVPRVLRLVAPIISRGILWPFETLKLNTKSAWQQRPRKRSFMQVAVGMNGLKP